LAIHFGILGALGSVGAGKRGRKFRRVFALQAERDAALGIGLNRSDFGLERQYKPNRPAPQAICTGKVGEEQVRIRIRPAPVRLRTRVQ